MEVLSVRVDMDMLRISARGLGEVGIFDIC